MDYYGQMLLLAAAVFALLEPFIDVELVPIGQGLMDFGLNPELALGVSFSPEGEREIGPEVPTAEFRQELLLDLRIPRIVALGLQFLPTR